MSGAARQFSRFSEKDDMVVSDREEEPALIKRLGYEAKPGREGVLSVETRDGSMSIDASPESLAERHAAEAKALLAARLWKVKD